MTARDTGSGGLARAARRKSAGLRRRLAVRRWRASQARDGTTIARSVGFTGVPLPAAHARVGARSTIEQEVTIWLSGDPGAQPDFSVGEDVFVGRNTYFGVYQPISIGAATIIGAYSYIISANHATARRDVPIREQGFVGEPIRIEDDVWIGTHVVILPGATLRRGCVVAAGSVVKGEVPAYEVWGGAPARRLSDRP